MRDSIQLTRGKIDMPESLEAYVAHGTERVKNILEKEETWYSVKCQEKENKELNREECQKAYNVAIPFQKAV